MDLSKIDYATNAMPIAQGDVCLVPVNSIPEGEYEDVKPENGKYIVTHSETGHHHVVEARPNVTIKQSKTDPLIAFLLLNDGPDVDLVHMRGHDTHAPHTLKSGTKYLISRQQQSSPAGWVKAAD